MARCSQPEVRHQIASQRPATAPVTDWLQAAAAHGRDSEAGRSAWENISAWSYRELEVLAERRLRREFRGLDVTLEPASLVNETFLRLIRKEIPLANRRHYFALVSRIMLRVLIDYQRRRRAAKRQVDRVHVTLSRLADGAVHCEPAELDSVFRRLDRLDARKGEVARLRALWGLGMTEIAETLNVSEPTVRRDWRFARNWLGVQLRRAH